MPVHVSLRSLPVPRGSWLALVVAGALLSVPRPVGEKSLRAMLPNNAYRTETFACADRPEPAR